MEITLKLAPPSPYYVSARLNRQETTVNLDTNQLFRVLLDYHITLDDQDPISTLINKKIVIYAEIIHLHAKNRPLNESEKAVHELIKRIAAIKEENQKTLFSKKIFQLLEQMNPEAPV